MDFEKVFDDASNSSTVRAAAVVAQGLVELGKQIKFGLREIGRGEQGKELPVFRIEVINVTYVEEEDDEQDSPSVKTDAAE